MLLSRQQERGGGHEDKHFQMSSFCHPNWMTGCYQWSVNVAFHSLSHTYRVSPILNSSVSAQLSAHRSWGLIILPKVSRYPRSLHKAPGLEFSRFPSPSLESSSLLFYQEIAPDNKLGWVSLLSRTTGLSYLWVSSWIVESCILSSEICVHSPLSLAHALPCCFPNPSLLPASLLPQPGAKW